MDNGYAYPSGNCPSVSDLSWRKVSLCGRWKCSMRHISRSGTEPASNEIAGAKPSRRLGKTFDEDHVGDAMGESPARQRHKHGKKERQ